MAYTIELSFNIHKHSSISQLCQHQRALANSYNCELQYFMNETENSGKNLSRNDCIHVIVFNEDHYLDFIHFLSKVYHEKSLYIECIYREDNSCNIVYISGRYLKRLDKNTAREIKRKYKKTILSNNDNEKTQILKILSQ